MKAVTLHQPWATLIAMGVKTIETRSWSTKYRGPLVVHAAKTVRSIDDMCFDVEEGWRYGYLDDDGEISVAHTRIDGEPVAELNFTYRGDKRQQHPLVTAGVAPLPLGAAVAVVDVVDCLPMLSEDEDCSAYEAWLEVGPDWIGSMRPVEAPPGSLGAIQFELFNEQIPFGDFAPGRFGWMLDNIRPLPEPYPIRGKQGLWTPDPEDTGAILDRVAS